MPPSPLDRFYDDGGHAVAAKITTGHDHLERINVAKRDVGPVEQRKERFAEDGFGGAAERAHALAVEAADAADEFVAASRGDGHFEAAFHGLGATIGKEGKLEIAGRDERDKMREVRAQRVDQFL